MRWSDKRQQAPFRDTYPDELKGDIHPMFNSRLRMLNMAAISLVVVFVCVATAGAEADKKKTIDKAASVNGSVIPLKDFEREFGLYQNHFRSQSPNLPPDFLKRLRVQVVNEMINQELLFQDSQNQKIAIGKDELDKEVGAFQKQFPNADQYKQWLAKMNFTEESIRTQFKKRMMVGALLDKAIASKVQVKEEEAKTYFEENPDKFRVEESVRARHILIKLDKSADEKAKSAARKTLTDIKKKILSGEDFAELAKAHSQGPSGPRGGDLGYFKMGQMVKPFEEAAFKLAVNEVSDIVETRFGYHLIKVLDHKFPASPKFEEVKEKTIKMVRDARIRTQISDYIGKLRAQATIETFVE